MSVSMLFPCDRAPELLLAIDTATDELNAADLSRLDESELRALLHGVERVARKISVTSHTVISECNERGSYTRWGYRRLSQMIVGELKISAADAARRIRVAAATVCQRSMTGEVQEPTNWDVSQALFDGDISEHQADTVLGVLDKIPSKADDKTKAKAEATMTDAAKNMPPKDIERVGERLIAHIDPDGTLSDDGDRAKRRGVTLSAQDAALMSKLSGQVDPATRAMLETLWDVWAKPGMNNPADPESPSGSYTDSSTDRDAADAAAKRDTRSPAQRRHDALTAMLSRFIGTGSLGSHRGAPAQVVIKLSFQELLEMGGVAETMSGGLIPVVDALQMATANSMLLAILDAQEMPLFLGRTKRLASVAQRIAMWLHARGCTHPSCDRPSSWTEAHHTTEWAKGGQTNIDELTPACPEHHALVGDRPEHWQTIVLTDGPYKGRCAWIPPASVDPHRTPRVNHVHHPEELLAQAWERVADRQKGPRGARQRGDPWV